MRNRIANSNKQVKIYTYNLPRKYRPTKELALVSETYYFIEKYIKKNLRTNDPKQADLFFVPINLVQFQFKNENPKDILQYLSYLTNRDDHLVIALGDFSQCSNKNHFGEAYKIPYRWLDKITLLALESTTDLLPGRDIGIFPINELNNKPVYNENYKPFLYSFYGELNHHYLPENHIRSRLAQLKCTQTDVFISTILDKSMKKRLRKNYKTKDDYEMIARNSIFSLAPAGYGRWTYRFFQSIFWGSIPVLLSDDYIKPFADYIPYDDFTITIAENQVEHIDSFLRSISPRQINEYQVNLKKHQHLFTPEGLKRLINLELESKVRRADHSSSNKKIS